MIFMQDSNSTLEEKIYELICEYGALETEQIRRYFDIEQARLEKLVLKLMKKGRLQQEREKEIVKTSIQETPDMRILHCFWLVLDLMEIIVSHGIGKYPLVIALYGDGVSFAVYDCKKGEEYALCHALQFLQEVATDKVLIVIEDLQQMEKLNLNRVTFCTISEEGEVKYYE